MSMKFSERELCDVFISQAKDLGFMVFPELGTWDIVIKRGDVLIGVQAKLEFNIKAIAQCLVANDVDFKVLIFKDWPHSREKQSDLRLIAYKLKIILLDYQEEASLKFEIPYPVRRVLFYYRHQPKSKLITPDYEYDLPAGVRSPVKVSEWKIKVCKLEKIAQEKGYITGSDVFVLGLKNVPRMYYNYNWTTRRWEPSKFKASKDFPHIWESLK